jgi:uncharacterized membrane protein
MLNNIPQIGAFALLLAIMVIGELISKLTKGKVPSALVISVLMIGGFWTILPKDIVARSGLSNALNALSAMLLVTNLSTLISRKEMIAQWRTVIINLMGVAAIIIITLSLGSRLFGWQNAVAAAPPLAGGVIATTLMQQAALEKGLQTPALVALICFVLQGIAGYPLTSFFLGKEARRLNKLYLSKELPGVSASGDTGGSSGGNIFTKLKSPAYILLKLSVVALLAYYVEVLIAKITGGFTISRYVWCLVLGFFASEFKFLERDALTQANSHGLLMNILLICLFGALNTATPELFWPVAGICLGMVILAALGMALMAFCASKIFKKNTFSMCYSIILTAFYGFPINVMLTNEAVEATSQDKGARDAIQAQILPKMLVGGFTSVTVVSVIIAGVLLNLY